MEKPIIMSEKLLFVFDTNVLISAHLKDDSQPAYAYRTALNKGIIVRSTSTFEEFATHFIRQKFNKYSPFDKRIEQIEAFKKRSMPITVFLSISAYRDPDDNQFLELAIAANAYCIVSGDEDLLVLHPFCNIPIVKPADFLKLF